MMHTQRCFVPVIVLCVAALLAAVSTPLVAQSPDDFSSPRPAAALSRAADAILRGVDTVSVSGTLGNLVLFGPNTVPLLQDQSGGISAALCIDGQRQALALTHDSFYKKDHLAKPGLRTFMLNAATWASKGKRGASILAFGTHDLPAFLTQAGYKVDSPRSFPQDLSGYDAIFLYVPTAWSEQFNPAALERLQKAFEAGTPVVASSLGWVFIYYGEGTRGADLATEFAGNLLLGPFGLTWGPNYVKPDLVPVTSAQRQPPALRAAFEAASVIASGREPGVAVAGRLLRELYAQCADLPDWRVALGRPRYDKLVDFLLAFGPGLGPTAEDPAKPEQGLRRIAIALVELISRRHPDDFMPLYDTRAAYPGQPRVVARSGGKSAAEPDQRRTATRVEIDRAIPRWHALGVYAQAGTQLRITIPEVLPADGLVLRIGAHRDDLLYYRPDDAWQRWPIIAQQNPLTKTEYLIFCRTSGPVYIEVPERTAKNWLGKPAGLEVLVSGGVAMPSFEPGEDPVAFLQEVAASSSPWVEVSTRLVTFTVPAKAVPVDFDPQRLADLWDEVALSLPALLGTDPVPYRHRFVCDIQPSMGYMHSGYPVVTMMDVASWQLGGPEAGTTLTRDSLFREGSWGHFHELGHNHQRGEWTFSGSGEVTVNLFTLHAMDKVLGIKPINHPSMTAIAAKVAAFRAKPDWEVWKKEPFIALHTYLYLIDSFGWATFTKVFQTYEAMPDAERPKTDQQKIDTWVLVFSQEVSKNLAPYFKSWAWPVSAQVEAKLSRLPVWKPAR